MRTKLSLAALVAVSALSLQNLSEARGFGGGGGGRSFGGGGSWGGGGGRSFGGGSGSYSGSRGSFSGSHESTSGYGARGGYGGSSSYDRSWSGNYGGSVSTSGTRGAAATPWGGYAAGGTRDTSITTPGGNTYSGERQGGFAGNQYGAVAGGSRYGSATGGFGTVSGGGRFGAAAGPYGAAAGGSRYGAATGAWGSAAGASAWRGASYGNEAALGRYSAFGAVNPAAAYGTAYWSHGAMATSAEGIRAGFGYYNAFNSGWYGAHPAAWGATAGWVAGNAWATPTWATVAPYIGSSSEPTNYDYGTNVVYQDNNVYVNGSDVGTADQYAQQASSLASAGQQANPPPTDQWQSLGVFALVQGSETTSNNIFQIAVNQAGIIRGNYYDGLMDQTTPIAGSVDKTSQRAAWTIGDKKDRVFEAGAVNLTRDQTAVLVHLGSGKTQQLMLVRMNPPQQQPSQQ